MRGRIPVHAGLPMADRPRWFRAAVGACDGVTRRVPGAGVRLAGVAGLLCHAGGWWGAAPSEVRELLPWLKDAEATRLARKLAADDLRCRAFDRLLYSGATRAAASLLSGGHVAGLARHLARHEGHVLLDVHSGPISATSVALHVIGRPAFIIRMRGPSTTVPGLEVAGLGGDGQLRAQVLRRAIDHVRAGRPVVLAADGWEGTATEPVSCCGRLVRFRRGAFVLARLTGAPIVPLFFRWGERGLIEIEAASPIRAGDGAEAGPQETAMAAEVAGWLERRLQARPSDLSLTLLRWFQRQQDSGGGDGGGGDGVGDGDTRGGGGAGL